MMTPDDLIALLRKLPAKQRKLPLKSREKVQSRSDWFAQDETFDFVKIVPDLANQQVLLYYAKPHDPDHDRTPLGYTCPNTIDDPLGNNG